jgi:hypothetical protein
MIRSTRVVYVDNDRLQVGLCTPSPTHTYDYYLGGCFLEARTSRAG